MTTKTKRSTQNGAEVELLVPFGAAKKVPSYVCLPGVSLDEGAKSLGLKVLGWRDTGDIVAEIHERGGGSNWCVKEEV